jgi:hypothetical protein
VFTADPKIVRSEKERVTYCSGGDVDVLCIDERKVMIRSKTMYDKPNPVAEGVKTDLSAR